MRASGGCVRLLDCDWANACFHVIFSEGFVEQNVSDHLEGLLIFAIVANKDAKANLVAVFEKREGNVFRIEAQAAIPYAAGGRPARPEADDSPSFEERGGSHDRSNGRKRSFYSSGTDDEFSLGFARPEFEAKVSIDFSQLRCERFKEPLAFTFVIGVEAIELFFFTEKPIPEIVLDAHRGIVTRSVVDNWPVPTRSSGR